MEWIEADLVGGIRWRVYIPDGPVRAFASFDRATLATESEGSRTPPTQ